MKKLITLSLIAATLISCKDTKEKTEINETTAENSKEMTMDADADMTNFNINPISHATMVLEWDDAVIYVDPVGGAEAFEGFDAPDVILITDIHGDHLNNETVVATMKDGTAVIAPQAVVDKLPEEVQSIAQVLDNNKTTSVKGMDGITFEAIPMYNLREEALKFHPIGRGNGYIITKNDKRVYISGDTEDIPEMRALKNIDVAFVCMNLPYTMTVESAASAVIEFAPKKVYPYHYRGTDGLSDVSEFKKLVNKGNEDVDVVQLDWYAE